MPSPWRAGLQLQRGALHMYMLHAPSVAACSSPPGVPQEREGSSIAALSCFPSALGCLQVPFLLSRKHAIVRVQPNGSIVIRDLNSTNGTYIGGEGEFLHRMRADEVWELKKGDIIGFGGPETIVARSEQPDIIVANPFLFKYSPLDDLDSIPPPQPEYVQPGYYGVLVSQREVDQLAPLQQCFASAPPPSVLPDRNLKSRNGTTAALTSEATTPHKHPSAPRQEAFCDELARFVQSRTHRVGCADGVAPHAKQHVWEAWLFACTACRQSQGA